MDREETALVKKPQTILLIDDEQIVIEPTCVLLERYGYTVITANSGEQAVDLFKKDCHNIDVIILDMLMPGMDGEETFNHIRRGQPDIPVFIASGYNSSDKIDRVMENGCNGYIKKPYRASDLHKEIQKCLT